MAATHEDEDEAGARGNRPRDISRRSATEMKSANTCFAKGEYNTALVYSLFSQPSRGLVRRATIMPAFMQMWKETVPRGRRCNGAQIRPNGSARRGEALSRERVARIKRVTARARKVLRDATRSDPAADLFLVNRAVSRLQLLNSFSFFYIDNKRNFLRLIKLIR